MFVNMQAVLVYSLCLLLLAFSPACNSGKEAEAQKIQAEAEQLLARQDYTAAVNPLIRLARLRPELPGVLPKLGRSVLHSADRNNLLKTAEAALSQKPDDAVALTIASSALLGKDDERKRLDYLRHLVHLRPTETLFLTTLAQELVNGYRYDEARPLLESLIHQSPDDPAGYFLRGQATFFAQPTPNGLAQAKRDFEKALELNTNIAKAYLYLGRIALLLGEPKEAIAQLTQAAEQMPSSAEVHFELAKAFQAAGDTEMAAKAQAQFVKLREQASLAESSFKRAGAFASDFDLQLKTAYLMMQTGDTERAITLVNRALTLRPQDSKANRAAQELDTLITAGGGR